MNIWNLINLSFLIYMYKNTASSFQDEEEIQNIKFNI